MLSLNNQLKRGMSESRRTLIPHIVAVLTLLLFLGSCGKTSSATNPPSSVSPNPSPNASTSPTMSSPSLAPSSGSPSSITSSPTPSAADDRSPIATPTPPAVAETEIGSSLIPENTTNFYFHEATINGSLFTNAMLMDTTGSPRTVQIDAGRRRHRFLGSVGIPDNQTSSSSVKVDISLDTAPPIFSAVINFGELKPIDLDVTNVLRVKITVAEPRFGTSNSSGVIGIGNPRFG